MKAADLWELPAVVVADHGVCDAKTVNVSHHALQSFSVCIISNNHARVSHQLS